MRYLIFVLVLLTCGSFNSFAQYKYDLGLKVSSFALERFQIDGRFHFKSPHSLLVSVTSGSQTTSSRSEVPVYIDSLFSYSSTYLNRRNHFVKVGVQRKLEFLASDVFYVGASLGVGYQRSFGRFYSGSYVIDSIGSYQNYVTDISYYETNSSERALKSQIELSFGLDVPITKRICINAELGLSSYYQTSLSHNNAFFSQHVYVSGGLRYQFGKRKS